MAQLEEPSPLFEGSRSIVAMPDGRIWITDSRHMVQYNPETREITPVVVEAENGPGAIMKFVVTKEGELWGVDFVYEGKSPLDPERNRQPAWILRKYDPATETFLEVQDPDRILYVPTYGVREIVEDGNGSFWILIHNDDATRDLSRVQYSRLIRYDTNTQKASEVDLTVELGELSLDNYIAHVTVSPDGILWLSVAAPISGLEEFSWKIVSYDPKAHEVTDFGFPAGEAWTDPPLLLFDQKGRLWTSAIAWLDFPIFQKAVWSPIIRPWELVVQAYSPLGFSWEEPFYIYETSDGSYWIGSPAGLQVYDPQQNLWYRVDKLGYYGVAEDENGQVWYAAGGQIYKLVTNPE